MPESVLRKEGCTTYFATQVDFQGIPDVEFKLLGGWCATLDIKNNSSQAHFKVVGLSPEFEYDPIYIQDLYHRLIPSVSQTLNQIHKLNMSYNQWETVIGYWLVTLLHPLRDRWQRLSSIASSGEDIELVVCQRSEDFNPAMTSMEDKRIETSNEYNSYVYADMSSWFESIQVNFMKGPIPSLQLVTPQSQIDWLSSKFSTIVSRVKESLVPAFLLVCKLTRLLGRQRCFLITSYIPLEAQLRLAVKTRAPVFLSYVNNIFFAYAKPSNLKKNNVRRPKSIDGFQPANAFEEYLNDKLFDYFPPSVIEDFNSYVHTLKEYNLQNTPEFTISEMLHAAGSDLGRIWMGLYGNRNKQLIVLQHGGAYGHYDLMWSYFFESRISSSFMSWGWMEFSLNSGVKNVPALRVLVREKSKPRNHLGILILLPPEFRFPHLYHPTQPIDADQTMNHLQVVNQFLGKLSDSGLRSVYLKAQKTDSQIAHEVFSEKLDILNFLESGSSVLLKSFNLLISTYAGTNTVECLMSDTPTIMLWPEEFCNFSGNAASVMYQLEKAGVLHKDYDSASRIASLDHLSLTNWWESSEVKMAVSNYLKYFGRTDGGPASWAAVIDGHIRANRVNNASVI